MAISLPVSILTAVLIGRLLGPSGKGEYTLATLVVGLLVTIFHAGIPASVSYFLGTERALEHSLVKTVVLMAAVFAGVGLAGVVLLDMAGWSAHVFGIPRLTAAMWLALCAFPFQLVGMYLQFVVLARGQRILFAALPAVGQFVFSAVTVALALFGQLSVWRAVGAQVVSQVLVAGILALYLQLRVNWWRAPLLGAGVSRNLLRYSAVTYVAQGLQFLVQRVDVFLVSVFLDLRAVGLYSVAYGTAELLLLLPQRFGDLYLPRVASGRTAQELARETPVSSSLVFVGTLASAGILSLIAPFAIRAFYGREFGPAVGPFLLLLPGVCGMAAAAIQSAFLSGVGRVNINAGAAAAALVLNVALNLVLIPRYGISGAAVASSAAYWLQALVLISVVSRITNTRPLAMLTSAPPAVIVGVLKRAFH